MWPRRTSTTTTSREGGRFPSGWACPTWWRRRKRWTSRVGRCATGTSSRSGPPFRWASSPLPDTPPTISPTSRSRVGYPSRCAPVAPCSSDQPVGPTCPVRARRCRWRRRQYRTLHRLGRLPDEVAVLPTHGFGSFCAVALLGSRRRGRPSPSNGRRIWPFVPGGEDAFVAALIGGLIGVSELLPPHGQPEPPRHAGAGPLAARAPRRGAAPGRGAVLGLGGRSATRAPTSPAHTSSGRSTSSTACSSRPISAGSSPEDTPLVLVGESR